MKFSKIILFSVVFILLVSSCFAGDVRLVLKDITSGDVLYKVVVVTDFDSFRDEQYIVSGDSLFLSLDDGVYDVVFKVDDPLTDAKDFFKRKSLDVNGSFTSEVLLSPVGSVRGVVVDSLDNRVPGAKLKFECSSNVLSELPEFSDETGFFSADYVGVGSCIITAYFKDAVGFVNVKVEKGMINNDVKIMLDKTIIKIPSYDSLIFIAVVMIVIVLVLLFFVVKKRSKKFVKLPKKVEEKEVVKKEDNVEDVPVKGEKINSRIDDIIKTLNGKERDVVNSLLNNNSELTQAAIRHNTSIPRTSLARVLKSLEAKNIIRIKKEGKAVKIALTDWFLGK